MANQHENAFNRQKKLFGKLFGQKVSINSVDYTATDQTPVFIKNGMYKVESKGPSLSIPSLPNVQYFCVHGDYYAVQPGYLLRPLRTDSSTPPVTVLNKSPFEEIVGFRTSRTCEIYSGITLMYSNVMFEYASTNNYPADAVHRMILSPKVPENQIIMYKRQLRFPAGNSITDAAIDIEGIIIKDVTDEVPVYWKVLQDTSIGSLMTLTVDMSVAE